MFDIRIYYIYSGINVIFTVVTHCEFDFCCWLVTTSRHRSGAWGLMKAVTFTFYRPHPMILRILRAASVGMSTPSARKTIRDVLDGSLELS